MIVGITVLETPSFLIKTSNQISQPVSHPSQPSHRGSGRRESSQIYQAMERGSGRRTLSQPTQFVEMALGHRGSGRREQNRPTRALKIRTAETV